VTPLPAPRNVFNDMVDVGVALLRKATPPTELDIRRFEKEIEVVSRFDPVGYLELRAYAAALRDQEADVDTLFERAMAISSQRTGAITRYLAVLALTARTDAVITHFRNHREEICNDIAALRGAQRALIFSGWFATGNAVGAEIAKRGLTPIPTHDTELVETLISEAEVASAVGFSHRFLRRRGARAKYVQVVLIPHEDADPSLFYQLGVEMPAGELAEVEWELFGALADAAIPAEQQGHVRVALVSWDCAEENDADHAA